MRYNLPESADEHEQEENSILALKNILKNKNFIIRDIRENDYGVDLNIEVKIVGNNKKYASNFISQVQIKDKINSENIKNKDGTYSFPVKTKTINYLSNQPASLFLIYLEDEDQIIWEWVNEIEKYAINKIGNINSQDNITYRFSKFLNSEAVNEIYGQIIRIGEKIKDYKDLILDKHSVDIIKHKNLIKSFNKSNEMIKEYINSKNYKKALKLSTNLADLLKDEDSYNSCAGLSYCVGDYKKALKFCNKSISINSNNSVTHLIKGSSLIRLKDYEEAKASIQASLSICESTDAYNEYGLLEFLLNNFNDSIKYLEKSIKLNVNNETAYLYLGKIYSSILNFNKAEYNLQKVIEINPENADALALLGENYFNQDKYENAIEYFNKSLDYDSKNNKSLLGMGLALISINRLEKGIIYISEWCVIHQKKILNKEKGILIVNIGWNKTICFAVTPTNKEEIKLVFSDGTEIPVKLPNKKDFIHIGILSNNIEDWVIPLVGKVFAKKKTFNYIMKELENNLELINFPKSNGQDNYFEFSNSTKLLIEEEKDRVYIELNFKEFAIYGYTDREYNKKGFYEFIKYYNKYDFFQVTLCCIEDKKEISFTVNGNVTIKKLEN
ncbi:DUF4365 domain-containing protein [Lysinibacillus varians]|uniref:Tetratricopeptide repeat protein n=1 Tax=Lysinibacillus varians TaxID=1145276 RepID=A0ABY2T7U4_9BACI|nr:DUF4365 domain-containing protein [Lysinibacillus varians]AHN24424.1 hypothetical protein T479_17045 [Lysinibacillus varians]TKI60255.1 tetratricopeptide repeat protein [Lysinibacillus varians]